MKKYFGTDGIRGIANKDLTSEFACKVAKAGGYILSKESDSKKKVLIAKDTRISGDMLESAMSSGFKNIGIDVETIGITPTPVLAYLVREEKASVGVVISASHNSYEYNGIKYFNNNGTKISDYLELEIEKQIDFPEYEEKIDNTNVGSCMQNKKVINKYIKYIKEIFYEDIKDNIKEDFIVGIDTANGATYELAERIFKELNIKYKIINNIPDGKNINQNCGSTNLEQLKKLVLENKLSLGIAYDGDGDRCLAVDENGKEINGDTLLAVFSKYMKENNMLKNNSLVCTIMSNLALEEVCKSNNINLIQTNVGDRYVLEEMQKNNYNLGGEQSGHIILSDFNLTGDGIITSLFFIKIILEKGIQTSKVCSIIDAYPQMLINVKVKNYDFKNDIDICNKINQIKLEQNGNCKVLIRKSGTEPLLRIMLEGKDTNYIEKASKELAKLIEQKLN